MSSGGFQRSGGLDAGHAELLGLRKQLGSTITETDRFIEMLNENLALHDREHTLFTPASEYLKDSVAHVGSALAEFKRSAERMGGDQVQEEDREALATSLDGLSCAVESLTHFARAFDEHKRSLPLATSHKKMSTQQPLGDKTQDSTEKLVRSVLTQVHLGFNTLQRCLGHVEHHGDPLRHAAPSQKDTEAQAKPARARQNSINVESLEEEGRVGQEGDRGYSGRVQLGDQAGPAP